MAKNQVGDRNSEGNDRSNNRKKRESLFSILGPGLVTGAADDDPSGVATYSIAGAKSGTSLLWMAVISWPFMAFVQMMCARVGMVTGEGLAAALRKKVARPVLILFCLALFVANTLNVGADLAAMGDAAEMLTGVDSKIFIILLGLGITWATVQLSYQKMALVLKWLALFLLAYIVTAFYVGPDWKQTFYDTAVPTIPKGAEAWEMVVAILGTTISPYLFFWQASQEVEEEKRKGRNIIQRKGATAKELRDRRWDVGIGTFASNCVMYFIILTTALTLYKHGIHNIETSKQAAEALRPIAGHFATFLYTAGLIGVGLLAIPTLTGSAGYAFAETFGWRQGLDAKIQRARGFYTIVILSMVTAIGLDFSNVNPVKALYWSAVVNGILAPFCLVGLILVASDKKIMCDQPSSKFSIAMVSLITALMFAAGIAMFVV